MNPEDSETLSPFCRFLEWSQRREALLPNLSPLYQNGGYFALESFNSKTGKLVLVQTHSKDLAEKVFFEGVRWFHCPTYLKNLTIRSLAPLPSIEGDECCLGNGEFLLKLEGDQGHGFITCQGWRGISSTFD